MALALPAGNLSPWTSREIQYKKIIKVMILGTVGDRMFGIWMG